VHSAKGAMAPRTPHNPQVGLEYKQPVAPCRLVLRMQHSICLGFLSGLCAASVTKERPESLPFHPRLPTHFPTPEARKKTLAVAFRPS
jgi:hypothetical protein